jgi:predicted GNAT family N-acyltransferase
MFANINFFWKQGMVIVRQVETASELQEAHRIRKEVFVVEQNCPEDLEWEFEEESTHFVALINGLIVGTARWRETENGYKLERFAVLKSYRNQQVGGALVQYLVNALPKDGKPIYLHAQLPAKNVYARKGFKPYGPHFWEADIEHVKMVFDKPLSK